MDNINTNPLPEFRLPPDQQDLLYEKIKGTPLEIQATLKGIIDPQNIRMFRQACKRFITNDPATIRVKEKAVILSMRPEPVLILGESGTGKELLANILHGERVGHFVAVNVCAVTDTLFESELFGHVKGAFTGADKERPGLIKQAENGTLFLDEIGDMPLSLQAKILRVVHNRVYRKVGSNFDEPVLCRIVAATHRNLPEMIKDGQFRLDLHERLQVFRLNIPPLRDRVGDITSYVDINFASKLVELYDHLNKDGSVNKLLSGNVRQLLNLKLKYDVFGEEELTKESVL